MPPQRGIFIWILTYLIVYLYNKKKMNILKFLLIICLLTTSCDGIKEKHVKGVIIEHSLIIDELGVIHYTTKIKQDNGTIVENNSVDFFDMVVGTKVDYIYY